MPPPALLAYFTHLTYLFASTVLSDLCTLDRCPLWAPWDWDEGERKLTVPLGDRMWLCDSISRGSISPRSAMALAVPGNVSV